LIDNFAELGSDGSASGSTNEATQNGTSDGSQRSTDRPCNQSRTRTDTSTTKNTGDNAGGTRHRADRAPRLFGVILRVNTLTVASWAIHAHGVLLGVNGNKNEGLCLVNVSDHALVVTDFFDEFDERNGGHGTGNEDDGKCRKGIKG
jgi:hypothetical protein